MVYMRILSSRCAVCVRHAFNYPDFAAKLSFVVIISTNRAKFETSWRGACEDCVAQKRRAHQHIYVYFTAQDKAIIVYGIVNTSRREIVWYSRYWVGRIFFVACRAPSVVKRTRQACTHYHPKIPYSIHKYINLSHDRTIHSIKRFETLQTVHARVCLNWIVWGVSRRRCRYSRYMKQRKC